MAQRYAIGSLAEARAYLEHSVLGERLRACTAAVNALAGRPTHEVFGSPDDMKFRSSMTLLALANPDDAGFRQALTAFFDGVDDQQTHGKLNRG